MVNIRLAKLLVRLPANASKATSEISEPDSTDLSMPLVSIENKVIIPIPPTQAVDMRQNCSPRGRASISFNIDAPVVVKPETLSNMALIGVNSLP